MLGAARKSNRCTKIRRRTKCTSPAVSLHHGIIPSSLKEAGCGVGGERRCSKRSAATTAIGLFSSPSCSTNFCNSRSRRPHPIFLNDPFHPFKRPLLMSSLRRIITAIGLLTELIPCLSFMIGLDASTAAERAMKVDRRWQWTKALESSFIVRHSWGLLDGRCCGMERSEDA